tara:strand:+ start:184 stop:330 length:147 start_codon:yes stop_codon:yes gene_type:complete
VNCATTENIVKDMNELRTPIEDITTGNDITSFGAEALKNIATGTPICI